MGNLCLGIDTGGTFTDLVLVDLDTGVYHYHKLPTTTKDPAQGILDGIASIVGQAGVPCEAVTFLVLGITIATNAVLEGKTARTWMLSTRGFRDILDLARQRRPHLFNLDVRKPQPPAARDCRCEVTERVAHDGTVVAPLREDDVRRAIACIRGRGVEATSVCFLHAYANPAHESHAKALIQELWPEVYVCTSCDVLAEFREFERFATATVNASLMSSDCRPRPPTCRYRAAACSRSARPAAALALSSSAIHDRSSATYAKRVSLQNMRKGSIDGTHQRSRIRASLYFHRRGLSGVSGHRAAHLHGRRRTGVDLP